MLYAHSIMDLDPDFQLNDDQLMMSTMKLILRKGEIRLYPM